MRHCSSRARHLTLLQSSPPWTLSMTSLLPMLTIDPFPPPSKPLLNLGRRHLTATTRSQIRRRCTASPWVHSSCSYLWALLILCQIVLHPCHKLTYFKTAGWEQEWIKTAKELVHDAFERSYKQADARDQNEPTPATSITGTKV